MTLERAYEILTANDCVVVDSLQADRIWKAADELQKWAWRQFEQTPDEVVRLMVALQEAGLW